MSRTSEAELDDLQGALALLRGKVTPRAVALVLGSGLGPVADLCDEPLSIGYAGLEGSPQCRVSGHEGRLVLGSIEGREVAAFCGRAHLYEGASPRELTYQLRLIKALGIECVLLTSSVGAVNSDYQPGSFMLVRDHINLTGVDPVGHVPFAERRPRFPDMTGCYDARLLEGLTELAFALDIPYYRGVLAGVRGPSYETPAEVRALRALGADAVSMSLVVEAGFARYLGLRVLGLTLVANAAGDERGVSHERVLATVSEALPGACELIGTALAEMRW